MSTRQIRGKFLFKGRGESKSILLFPLVVYMLCRDALLCAAALVVRRNHTALLGAQMNKRKDRCVLRMIDTVTIGKKCTQKGFFADPTGEE